jgi:hypothetical protein
MLENGDGVPSIEWSQEISNKIHNIIYFLIKKENILMVTQEAINRNDIYLTMDSNITLENISNLMSSSA